jgi:hypothetical protein
LILLTFKERSTLIQNLSLQLHYHKVYQLVSNGWKYGEECDDGSKISPYIKHFHALSTEEKAEYVNKSRLFLEAISGCNAYLEPLDNLEWLYLQVACTSDSSTDHVAEIFRTYQSVCPLIVLSCCHVGRVAAIRATKLNSSTLS